MGSRSSRAAESSVVLDRRRSTDRREAVRTDVASGAGRRARDGERRPAPADSVVRDADEVGQRRKRRATRDGREALVVYMRPESIKALKIAALEYDTTASAIVTDAVTA